MTIQSSTPPADSGFVPRKEFIRDQARAWSAFSILAISGSSCIRLYAFPVAVANQVRRLFEQRTLLSSYREDEALNLREFTLDGKPWSNPKSVNTEKILVDIITVIYQFGYSYLSTIDYGRENDDRLAMAFSKPSSLPGSPAPSGSPVPMAMGAGSSNSLSQLPSGPRKIPFALSFPSATTLRVINPPLHSTPAILQAVRGSWPRGVVSERKIGSSSFEFKLKGYKWFQEDTFAVDSLQHILSLLSSLDAHSFTLVSSLSLSNTRSRVKDLWIFTGIAPPGTSTDSYALPDSPAGSFTEPSELRRAVSPGTSEPPTYSQADHNHGSSSGHKRQTTVPQFSSSQPYSPVNQHVRSATEGTPARTPDSRPTPSRSPTFNQGQGQNSASGLLRKPAPRAQVPISVAHEDDHHLPMQQPQEDYRMTLPSTVGSAENMTGIGSATRSKRQEASHPPTVFYSSDKKSSSGSPHDSGSRSTSPITSRSHHNKSSSDPAPFHSSNSPTPPSSAGLTPRTPPAYGQSYGSSSVFAAQQQSPPVSPNTTSHPNLLGSDVFRDSTMSSEDAVKSCVIPIAWTGGLGGHKIDEEGDDGDGRRHGQVKGAQEPVIFERRSSEKRPKYEDRMSTGPMFPGAWSTTPMEEAETASISENDHASSTSHDEKQKDASTPVHEVDARVTSPVMGGDSEDKHRKSESGLVGMMALASPPLPDNLISEQKGDNRERDSEGTGWVLVNVQGKSPSLSESNKPAIRSPQVTSPAATTASPASSAPVPALKNPGADTQLGGDGVQSSMNAAAKTIVMMDAVDTRDKVRKSSKDSSDKMAAPALGSSGGGIRRFFSRKGKAKKGSMDSSTGGSSIKSQGTRAGATSEDSAAQMNGKMQENENKGPGFKTKLKKGGASETRRTSGDARRDID